MRSHTTHVSLAAGLLALSLVLICGSASSAALTEKALLDGINDTVAVLRYHHRIVADAQYNLELCQSAKELTQRQFDAETTLLEMAKAKGEKEKERTLYFQNRVDLLKRQLKKLDTFDYAKTYSLRIDTAKAAIAKLTDDLNAHMTEYEVLFGKKAHVEIAFEQEMAKYRPRREGMAYFLILD